LYRAKLKIERLHDSNAIFPRSAVALRNGVVISVAFLTAAELILGPFCSLLLMKAALFILRMIFGFVGSLKLLGITQGLLANIHLALLACWAIGVVAAFVTHLVRLSRWSKTSDFVLFPLPF
jgi:hypothetical protein